jgi:hypothetical protein
MRWLLMILFFISCAENKLSTYKVKSRYELMNELWNSQTKKSEVILALGNNYKLVDGGIVYRFSSFDYPQSGHFFNKAQFLFLDDNEFQVFKSSLSCQWDIEKKTVSFGHSFKKIEQGKCIKFNLSYTYPSNLNMYEVRWER